MLHRQEDALQLTVLTSVVVTGTLQRLFTFAKATGSSQLENFTTEVLAAAIAAEPRVVVSALSSSGLVRPSERVEEVHVATQVHVPGGVVDLAMELVLDGHRRLFWIEVKAHAGIHGPQLQVYLDAAATYPVAPKPTVIMLCKRPMTETVPTLRWNALRRAIGDDAHLYWRDLRSFLEDKRVADDFDEPISVGELEVALAAHRLLRKTARMAHEFLRSLPSGEWDAAKFPTMEERVLDLMADQFRRHHRLVVPSKRYPWVNFGLVFEPGTELAVWIEFSPKDFDARDAVFALARSSALPNSWTMHASGWAWLGTGMAVDSELDHEVAITWLTERFAELSGAGIFAELKKWRRYGRLGSAEETEEADKAEDGRDGEGERG